jgi:hypothetical protein
MFLQMLTKMLLGEARSAKMRRIAVFKKINHERMYQQSRWDPKSGEYGTCVGALTDQSHPVEERYHEVGAWISFMESYLAKARDVNSTSDDLTEALLGIRKVVALGVACLEQHGCPDRPGWGPEQMVALVEKQMGLLKGPNKAPGTVEDETSKFKTGVGFPDSPVMPTKDAEFQEQGPCANGKHDPECPLHGSEKLLQILKEAGLVKGEGQDMGNGTVVHEIILDPRD